MATGNAFEKQISIEVAREHYNFEPIPSDLSDEVAGFNGKFVHKMQCTICGKRYHWRSGLRMLRHHMDHKYEK